MRSIWWISEVPGSNGLWASSSARMQPMALQSRGGARLIRSKRSPCIDTTPRALQPLDPLLPSPLLLPHVDAGGLCCHPQQQLGRSVPVPGTAPSQGVCGRASAKEAPCCAVRTLLHHSQPAQPPTLTTHHSVTTLGVIGFDGIP